MSDNNDKTDVNRHHLSSATSPPLNNGMIAKSHDQQQQLHSHNHRYNHPNSHQHNHIQVHQPLQHELINHNILYINVGGEVFTTTKNTMIKSVLFEKLFSEKKESDSSEVQYLENIPQSELVKRQTTFERYCVEHLESKKEERNDQTINTNNVNDGIYQINSNYYFVDRSPLHFDDILHFLRNYPMINGQEFIDRYYSLNNQYTFLDIRKNSFSALSSNNSNNSSNNNNNSLNASSINNNIINKLLRLQDEARFYQINPLVHAIQEKLDEENRMRNEVSLRLMPSIISGNICSNYSWWDQSGPLGGIRRIPGTKICFATSMDNWVDKHATFDIPATYKWASQSEYLEEYYSKRLLLQTYKEWIHFGIGDWDNYRWKYTRKIAFIFKDTFKGQRFVHSGMEVCDINHVKSLGGAMSESPLMEYDDNRGIVEGFAGLVLLAPQIYNGTGPTTKKKTKDKPKHKEKKKHIKELQLQKEQSAPSTTSTWTSDEDDEQIQSLKKKNNAKNNVHAKQTLLPINHNHNHNNHSNNNTPAVGSYPSNLPPPQLANTFAEYTKKQRAALTKNNLDKHTQLEHARHIQEQHTQPGPPPQQQIIQQAHQPHNTCTQQQQPQQYIHQSPQYIHHQFNPNGHFHYGQLPIVPAPQLQPRLSVNSLPVPTTNHSLIHQTQKHK